MPPAGGGFHPKGGCLPTGSLPYLPISPVISVPACRLLSQPQAQGKSSNPNNNPRDPQASPWGTHFFPAQTTCQRNKQSANESRPWPSFQKEPASGDSPRPDFTQAFSPVPFCSDGSPGKVWVLGSQTENLSRAQVTSGLWTRLCFLLGAPHMLIHHQRLWAKGPLCLCQGTEPPQALAGRREEGRVSRRMDKTDCPTVGRSETADITNASDLLLQGDSSEDRVSDPQISPPDNQLVLIKVPPGRPRNPL